MEAMVMQTLIVEQLADWLRVSRGTVMRWIKRGDLKGTKKVIDGTLRWTFNKEQIINYLERYNNVKVD
jgi:excisionase family DNA binding protein